ncbi:MAG: F0F1 ATP synthase subunit A [Acidobacteriota bacterium]|nr:F0F1 ATP synthase subunit A [Acidobacteriota bacterium]
MKDQDIWLTRLFNHHLAGLGNGILNLAHMHAEDPARPWANFIVMQLLVALIIIVLFAILKARLSVSRPGKLQHIFEIVYEFLKDETHDNVGHGGRQYLPLFGSLFIFILIANLIGVIPGLESPTQVVYVPAGLALIAFFYYNWMGIRANGLGKYLAHFAGPIWWMAPLMIPIEIISHLARPLSLTIRLFANMYAGEKVTLVFLSLTYLIAPAIFMGLHVFVGLLQAYIFALLTMIYVGGAVAHEH